MGKTLEVTADRSDSIDDLVAAGELLDMRFQPGRSSLSLSAAKLLHALIRAAGADAGLPKVHRIALSKLNYDLHLSKEEVMNIVREMFGVIVELKVLNSKGKPAIKIGSLLSDVERDEEKDGEIRYELSPVLRASLKNSNHWAVLSRKAVMAFQSRYSLRLYELLSKRVGLSRVTSEYFSLDDIRALFGVPYNKLPRWQDLKTNVIGPAIG
ncbi:replication initiation protein, partial [Sphingomonas parapaucimobilis]